MTEPASQAGGKPAQSKKAQKQRAAEIAASMALSLNGSTIIDTRSKEASAPKPKKNKKRASASPSDGTNSTASSTPQPSDTSKMSKRKEKEARARVNASANAAADAVEMAETLAAASGKAKAKRPKQQHHFSLREIVPVSSLDPPQTVRFMTYNVLSQGLCRRAEYPTNGKALEWELRFAAFEWEIKNYKPDILFLQEVDLKYADEWGALLKRCGLIGTLARSQERGFGVVTAYNQYRWTKAFEKVILYDDTTVAGLPLQCKTACVGYLAVLEPIGFETEPILVANTHLYWHPNADYERCRQMVLLLQAMDSLREKSGARRVLFGGDLNSTPESPCQEYLTGELTQAGRDTLRSSIKSTDLGRAQSLFGEHPPKHAVRQLHRAFKTLKISSQSLYSGYSRVDAENAGPTSEPLFTNWSDDFQNTIDYLMAIRDPQPRERLHVLKLLRLPRATEMGPEPNSLPRIGYYPSDHLALMAEVAWVNC